MRKAVALAVIAVLLLAPLGGRSAASAGTTFDAAADFSTTANPSGVWSYGWSASQGSEFMLDTTEVFDGGVEQWRSPTTLPNVFHNPGDTTVYPACCNPIPAGTMGMHPGSSGENAVLRFTAPVSGSYHIAVTFIGRDTAGTTTDVAVLSGGEPLFQENVNGFGDTSAKSFDGDVTLAAGDTVDFTVGFGTNGTYISDTTGIAATITQAPTEAPPPSTPPPAPIIESVSTDTSVCGDLTITLTNAWRDTIYQFVAGDGTSAVVRDVTTDSTGTATSTFHRSEFGSDSSQDWGHAHVRTRSGGFLLDNGAPYHFC